MSIVVLAAVIVASFAGGGSYFVAARVGAGAWLAFMLGLLVFGVVMALTPGVIP